MSEMIAALVLYTIGLAIGYLLRYTQRKRNTYSQKHVEKLCEQLLKANAQAQALSDYIEEERLQRIHDESVEALEKMNINSQIYTTNVSY